MKRVPTAELLDSDAGTAAEIAAALSDLRRINRWFGGVSTTTRLLTHVAHSAGKSELSLLEVAAGSGYVPKQALAALHRRGINLQVTLLDRAPTHLGNSAPSLVADALSLPFPDCSFDVVSSNLFAHHLSPQELSHYLRNCLRVCRIAVLINDLIRHPLHLALVYAGYPLYRSRLTRHDAPASVRQAYTIQEMRNIAAHAGAARLEITRHYLFRMGVIIWKK